MLHKAWNSNGEMPYCFPRSSIKFQGHKGQNITDFDPNWAFPDYRPVTAFKSLRFALFMQLLQFLVSNGQDFNLTQMANLVLWGLRFFCIFYEKYMINFEAY